MKFLMRMFSKVDRPNMDDSYFTATKNSYISSLMNHNRISISWRTQVVHCNVRKFVPFIFLLDSLVVIDSG